ncbi:MAG: 50S ribosomal protein L11 methyltransferase [Oscillospiraceae bacterium]
MIWEEICIKVKTEFTETAAAIAVMTVPYGIYIEDYSDMEELLSNVGGEDYIECELISKDRSHSIIHIYIPNNSAPKEAISFISERLKANKIDFELSTLNVSEDDWANNWKKYYHPERIGKRLVICPSWESYDPKPQDLVLTLDPGSSFGSGKHETTRLCLELIEGEVKSGDRVLDVGCGSGILSIAAIKLGAQSAAAVDIDKNAAATAAQNAAANFDTEGYTTFFGDIIEDKELSEKIGNGYDLISANIVADVIISMKDMFFDKLKESGTLIVSGIIDTRSAEVVSELEGAGFVIEKQKELHGWVAAVLKKQMRSLPPE